MLDELRTRGQGRRESGAFLLARRDKDLRRIVQAVYLDDLDPECLQGGIAFSGLAYSRLGDICDAGHLVVCGDVHAHPGSGVHQSSIDMENPMIARKGHLALIVPRFAMGPIRSSDVGVHEYRGDDGWTSWTGADAAKRLRVGWWL